MRPFAETRPLCKIKLVPLLLTYPIGKLWARYVPNVSLFGISLNPGPFTIKEHVIVTIMASVGAVSAYAVSVALVTQSVSTRSHQFYSDRHHCRPKGFLQSESWIWLSVFSFGFGHSLPFMFLIGFLPSKNRSVDAGHVDPANWLLHRWYLQAVPRGPAIHDLAREPRDSRALQHVALPGDFGYPFPRRCFPWPFLHICLRRLHLIQSAFLSWRVLPLDADWLS